MNAVPTGLTHRNGYRSRAWDTQRSARWNFAYRSSGRGATSYKSLLEPRRRSEKALQAVIQQAYVEGVSTREG